VTVNLADGTGRGGHAQGDVLTGIEDLTGSGHADTLTGDDGNNRFDGGAGADVFVFNPADGVVGDTIVDFEDGTDIVRIHDSSSFGDLTITDSGGDMGRKQHPDVPGSGPYPADSGRLHLRLMPFRHEKDRAPSGRGDWLPARISGQGFRGIRKDPRRSHDASMPTLVDPRASRGPKTPIPRGGMAR